MRLYKPIHEEFERFCRVRVYGEMEHGDLINETLVVAYQNFHKVKKKDKLLSFLIGSAIKILANSNKKKKAETGIVDINQSNLTAPNQTEERVEVRLLYEAIAKLPEEQRESIILFEITGYSIKEIAKLHKVGESAVKQRLRRARIKLQELLIVQSSHKEKQYG